MITIHTNEILKIVEGSYHIETLKTLMQNYPNISIGIYRNGRIIQLMTKQDILQDKPVLSCTLRHNENIFDQARELFYSFPENVYSCIPVIDASGAFIYYLSNELNQVSEQDYVSNFEQYDIKDPHIDYELVSRGDVFLFSKFEEYSYQIARIILDKFPDKYVFFLDPTADMFFTDSPHLHILNSIHDFYLQYKNLLHKSIFLVHSEKNFSHDYTRFVTKTYSSLEIMTSLFWACDIVSYGEKNPEKTFYLIKNPLENGGLADLIKFTLFRIAMISQKPRHFIPVIDLSLKDDNQFNRGNGDNAWTYFFDQLTDIPLEEVYQSKNVIISNNQLELFNPYVQEQAYFIKWTDMFQRYLKINDTTQKYIEEMYTSIIPNKNERIMGVIGRGTDYNCSRGRWVTTPMEPNSFLNQVIQLFSAWECSAIFLATEDAEMFKVFMESPLKDQIIYVDQERVDYSDPRNKDLFLAEIKKRNHTDGYMDNLRYFGILYILSKCTSLISTCHCGACNTAFALNGGKYEHVHIC